MGKKYRNESDVRLIPYYQYDPEIHEIDTRYVPQASEGEYYYAPQQEQHDQFDASQGDYRFVPLPLPVPGPVYPAYPPVYGRPRRRRRRPYYYGPVPVPYPYHPPYGGYPYGGGYYNR